MSDITLQARADLLVQREVQLCLSSMVATLANAYGCLEPRGDHTRDLSSLAEQASELCMPGLDYEETARQAGWTHCAKSEAWTHDDHDDYHADAEELCESEGLDVYTWEVFEHWAVSTWLAEELQEAGERVDTDFAGLNVWARTTTGQAISMDSVILKIAAALHA